MGTSPSKPVSPFREYPFEKVCDGVHKYSVKPGSGINRPAPGTAVMVHYTGFFENGKPFDSSKERDEPFLFHIGRGEVIKCWDAAVATMTVGEKAILKCEPNAAYGARGAGGVIPPHATLYFEVERLQKFGAETP